MKKIWLILFVTLDLIATPLPHGYAECSGDTCINVEADQAGNQVVITVKKGTKGSSTTASPRPRITSTVRKPWIPWLPRPNVTRAATPRPATTSKPRVRMISSSQITDQVKSLLPTGSIITQPLSEPLVNQPVNFLTTVPTHFSTVIVVLRIPITIHLTALYIWDFGDGKTLVTKLQGAPYPAMINHHTYTSIGEKKVNLSVSWSGVWSAGAISGPINGSITQRLDKEIEILPAKTLFVG